MEAGALGAPMDRAVLHVVEEPKTELDPVTVLSPNMEVKPVQAHPHQVLAATQVPVQLMEAGDPGAPMVRASGMVHVEQKAELDPVTVHSRNMGVKPVQDKPQRVLAVTRIHVKVSLRCQKEVI